MSSVSSCSERWLAAQVPMDAAGAAAAFGGAPGGAAAGPHFAAPGDAAGAVPGPPMGGLPPGEHAGLAEDVPKEHMWAYTCDSDDKSHDLMPPDPSEGAELDGMDSNESDVSLELEEEDAGAPFFMKDTTGGNTCACLLCCFFCS